VASGCLGADGDDAGRFGLRRRLPAPDQRVETIEVLGPRDLGQHDPVGTRWQDRFEIALAPGVPSALTRT